jgi:hypothetical protein
LNAQCCSLGDLARIRALTATVSKVAKPLVAGYLESGDDRSVVGATSIDKLQLAGWLAGTARMGTLNRS